MGVQNKDEGGRDSAEVDLELRGQHLDQEAPV